MTTRSACSWCADPEIDWNDGTLCPAHLAEYLGLTENQLFGLDLFDDDDL